MEELKTRTNTNYQWLWGVGLIVLGLSFVAAQIMGMRGDDLLPIFIMAGIGATFYVVYHKTERKMWPLVISSAMWAGAAGVFIDVMVSSSRGPFHFLYRWEDAMIAGLMMSFFSVPCLAWYRRSRKMWVLILPAIFATTFGAILIDTFFSSGGLLRGLRHYQDAAMAIYITSVLSVPFVVSYTRSRKIWLLVVPMLAALTSGALTLEALIYGGPLNLLRRNGDEIIGAYITLVLALSFLMAYAQKRSRLWALITGGIMLAISAGLLISSLVALIPVVMIAGGLYLLLARRTDTSSEGEEPALQSDFVPLGTPEADRPRV